MTSPLTRRRALWAWIGVCLSTGGLGTPARAFDYQVHGYGAQGFLDSSHDNYFGDSIHGSTDFYEAGLNGSLAPCPSLLLAAQVAIRDAGATDTGRPRLDFALADYRILSRESFTAGVRAGKVKNPIGFYNATRDVVFTRPGILMPAIYGDDQDQRNLIFAAPGGQIYGDALLPGNDLSLTLTASRPRGVDATDRRLLIVLNYGSRPVPFGLRIDHSWNFQLMDSIDQGRWQIAYSRFHGRFMLDATLPSAPPLPLFGRFDVDLDYLSARFNGERLTLTTEYALDGNKDFVALGGQRVPADDRRIVADGGYVQADYRIGRRWAVAARADSMFLDRGDRDGRAYAAANPGSSRYARFTYDAMLAAHGTFGPHWGVWAEYHWLYGTAIVQPLDNLGRTPAPHWTLLALMGAYEF